MIHWLLAIWLPLPFLNPACRSRSPRFMYCWSLVWRILSIVLLACEVSVFVLQFLHSLALLFFGIRKKTGLFQSHGHCWVFQIWWHIECSTLTASSYWNGLPFPSPRDLPDPGSNRVSCISYMGRWILYHCATWETHLCPKRWMMLTGQ